MVQLEPPYEPHLLEEEARALWKSRRLPPAGGMLGLREGPVVLQFEGSFTPGEPDGIIAQRAVAADVDARYLALAGRQAQGTLRGGVGEADQPVPPVGAVLERLGVWVGGDGTVPWDRTNRHARVETMVGNLAHRGVVVSRDLPLRACPSCGEPRSPERIIYQEEEGDTYLVRFDLAHGDQKVHALVWVDAPWRLLGTSALLVNPELPYVIAKYRRKDAEELVLTSRSSLERFRAWLPGASFEVMEEHPGRFFEGRTYDYPLRHEFPTGGALAAPGGTILAVPDVTDSGTGMVALVPGHGSTDAAIAESRGVSGWPLVTPRGQLDLTLMHKYAGLDLRTGSEFIVRDLTENDAIFAHLRVRRGVPHCAVCGSALVWIPGRAWCLEPARLPPESLQQYARLLPEAPALNRVEVAPWPLSGTSRSDHPDAIALLECPRCERLEALGGPVACPCGGRRYPVRRLLVPSAAGALGAWARYDPFPPSDSLHLYVGERRRVPAVVHHLMAIAALERGVGDVGLTLLPTVSDANLSDLIATTGADAVRAALVRAAQAEGAAGAFAEHCRVERDRLARLWATARDVAGRCDPAMLASFLPPVGGFLGELEAEDRAILARWERSRVLALADYDHWNPTSVHRKVFRFLETDLPEYRAWVRTRLSLAGSPPTKRAALRTLVHLLRNVAILLGPIAPHTCETIYRQFANERTSLFEGALAPVDRTLLNDELQAAWDRWRSVVHAAAEFRRDCGIAPDAVVPSAALLVSQDDLGDKLRADRTTLERLANVTRVDVGSPREPWQGRQRQMRPVESEIQRVYPSQATQVVHLLGRFPTRKTQESGPASELSVVIQGQPLRIFPSMVDYVDTLPPGVLPCPWPYGEMYLELPAGAPAPDRIPPPLSSDAFWLVRRLEQRLRRDVPAPVGSPRVAVIATTDPLASELRGQADALARYLGLAEVRVPEAVEAAPPTPRLTGRTRAGGAWWVHVPGQKALPSRSKQRPTRVKNRRFPAGPPASGTPELDYGSDEVVARWQAIRALGTELDGLMGAPLLGPSKLSRAWDQGLTSVDAYRHTPFDTLVTLPGFDRTIASMLAMKLGGEAPAVPAPRARSPPVTKRRGNGERAPGASAPENLPAGPALVGSTSPPAPPPPAPVELGDTTLEARQPSAAVEPLSEVNGPSPEEMSASPAPPEGAPPAPVDDGTITLPSEPSVPVVLASELPPQDRSPPESIPEAQAAEVPVVEPAIPSAAEATTNGPSESPLDAAVNPRPEPPSEQSPPFDGVTLPSLVEPAPSETPPVEVPSERDLPDLATTTEPEPSAENGSPSVTAPSSAEFPPALVPAEATEAAESSEVVEEPIQEPELTGQETTEPTVGPETPGIEAAVGLEPPEGAPAELEAELPAENPPAEPASSSPVAPEPEPSTEAAEPKPPPAGIELEVGVSLLSSIQPFLDATAAGHRGICVVRESPERVSAQVGSRPVDVYWLTNLGRGKTLKPNDLPGIFAFLGRAVGEEHVTVFFLEGIEYLIRIHGVEAVVERLLEFDLEAKAQDARVWVHLTSDLLRPDDLERIVASFGPTVIPV